MVVCNTKRVKKVGTDIIFSEFEMADCEQRLTDADMLDFMTDMDDLSFYEKTAWNQCEDLIYVKNEEALWQTIVGEIKTPYGALNNSIGQANYGCRIWDYIGELLHIKIKNPLKLKRVGKVKLALLYDEKQTIEQYKINNDDTIAIIKEDVEVCKKKVSKF